MKKILTVLLAIVFVLALSACGNNVKDNNLIGGGANQPQGNQTTVITRERAIEIAVEKAGVSQADVRDLDIELDNELGGKVWEIDFDHGNLEYSYDVNAETGVITKVERERD